MSTKKKAPTRSRKPGGRSPAPVQRKANLGDWVGGARLRTLPLSVAPVAMGTAAAYAAEGFEGWHWVRALLCLAVAVALQIGVNFANDYSDGVRGTDSHRVGPSRLTGGRLARPRTVLIVALVFFALAAAAGVALVVLTEHWWLLAVGAACLAAAWFYTGGKHPYGYYGLGELFVFVFFGLVATVGTTWVQAGQATFESWIAGVAAGLLACAVLMSNNLRDLEQDRIAGKRTLAVLVGSLTGRILFAVFQLVPFGLLVLFFLFYPSTGYVWFALLVAVPATVIALTAKTAPEFLLVLRLSSLTALAYGLGVAAGIAF